MMNIRPEKNQDTLVLYIDDERIDAHCSGELKAYVLEQVERGETRLAVHLAKVRFIDSSGLGALLSGYKNAAAHGGKLALCNVQPQVLAMFELTRLNRVFEIYPDLAEALESGA